jgi:DNA-binding NarL/FixJ family response regulator
MSIRVVIADDHPLVRDGLRFRIEGSNRGIEITGEASDGSEALRIAELHPVDVFVLDITMPGMNGLDAARELIRRNSKARIIILSIHDSHALVEEAIRAGARGYITKETASRNVVEAICEVDAGRFYLSADIAHIMVEKAFPGMKTGRSVQKPARLSLQERRILQLIAEGRSNKEIAVGLGRSLNTVLAHRKSLMAKLDIHKQADLVRFAVREGIAKL